VWAGEKQLGRILDQLSEDGVLLNVTRAAKPGGVTVCFIWTIRRMSADDLDFHLVLLFGL
jgi:hypothetical protein